MELSGRGGPPFPSGGQVASLQGPPGEGAEARPSRGGRTGLWFVGATPPRTWSGTRAATSSCRGRTGDAACRLPQAGAGIAVFTLQKPLRGARTATGRGGTTGPGVCRALSTHLIPSLPRSWLSTSLSARRRRRFSAYESRVSSEKTATSRPRDEQPPGQRLLHVPYERGWRRCWVPSSKR